MKAISLRPMMRLHTMPCSVRATAAMVNLALCLAGLVPCAAAVANDRSANDGELQMSANWSVVLEVEEDVYRFEDAKNGAGPQWCFGSTTLARLGSQVFASGLETIAQAKPLHNVRWTLFRRDQADGWRQVYVDQQRTREPSPIGVFPEDRVLVTANPTLAPPDSYSGPALPQVVEFDAAHLDQPPRVDAPQWSEPIQFTEHSYRSFTVDPANRELLYLNNYGYNLAYWSFRDGAGRWSASGKLTWPRTHDVGGSNPLRVCYPSVALRDRAVYLMGVSDIVEPDEQFKSFKLQLTGNQWDYIFCRLYFTWTPDVTTQPFRPWVELANCESTRGGLSACDLYVGRDGLIHLLWHENNMDVRLRQRFFPDQKWITALHYAQVRDGQVMLRRTVLRSEENQGDVPLWGRFHVTPAGRLMVVSTVRGAEPAGQATLRNRLTEISPDGTIGPSVDLPLRHAFQRLFFTATPRGGTLPSPYLDLLGQCEGLPLTLRYARLRVE